MFTARSLIIILWTLRGSFCLNNCEYSSAINEGFQYTAFANGSGYIALVGDVNNVLQGVVTPEASSTVWTHETTGMFGFGAAALGSLEGLGEAIIANGVVVVRQTDNRTENHFHTITGNEFRSPFSVFVSNGSSPDGNVVFYTQYDYNNITMTDFYERVYEAVGRQPFCYYGLTEFVELEGVAVSKAPIYNEPLFGDMLADYYAYPNFQLRNEYGLTIGCAANYSNIQDPVLTSTLLKLLYSNAFDIESRGELEVHSHVLSLRKCLKSPAEIDVASALDIYHILSNTTISFISANVYTLSNVNKIVELKPTNKAAGFLASNVFVYLFTVMVLR